MLLGIRTAVKADLGPTSYPGSLLGHSVSKRVYGTTLCLPGEFFSQTTTDPNLDPTSYVDRLTRAIYDLQPPQSRPQHRKTHIPKDLQSCTHVSIRRDAVRSPLQPPYDCPFKVILRATKFFKVDLGNRTDTVSIDRLKPSHLDTGTKLPAANPRDEPTAAPEPQVRPWFDKQDVAAMSIFQSATFLSFIVNSFTS